MIKNEKNNLPESGGSKLNAEQIKKWADDIAQAKGAQGKELRIAFKKQFGVNFSKKLVEELTAPEEPETPEVASKIVTPEVKPETSPETEKTTSQKVFKTLESEVRHASIDLDALVASQEAAEAQEAAGTTSPELNQATAEINEVRGDIVNEAKDNLGAIAEENLDNLSEAEKEELNKLDGELNDLSVLLSAENGKLSADGLSPEDKKKIEDKMEAIQDNMVFIINKKNEIRGKGKPTTAAEPKLEPAPEPTPEPAPNPEPAPVPELNKEPVVEPTAELTVEPTPEPTVEPLAELTIESQPEAPRDKVLEKFSEFNIKEEEIKNLRGFSELTQAQQLLVFEGLKQMSLVEIKEGAKRNVDTEISQKKWVGRIWGGLAKRYRVAKQEKAEAFNKKYGGLPIHQKNIEDLSSMIMAMRIEATIENNKVRINYLKNRDSFGPEQQKVLTDFNNVANNFSNIPQEWSLETATKEQQEDYRYNEYLYKRARAEALNVLDSDPRGGNTFLEMNQADYQVKLAQLLTANPEMEKEFARIEKKSALRQAITGEAAVRGSYMASGFLVRNTLAGLAGLGGIPMAAASFAVAPLAAAGFGAFRSRARAKTSLIERDVSGRKNDSGQQETGAEKTRKDIVKRLKNLVPTEYALKPKEWYDQLASPEEKDWYDFLQSKYKETMDNYQKWDEKERDKKERHFYQADDLVKKLELANKKANSRYDDEYKTALHYLRVRVQFIEEKLEDGLVNFGSKEALNSKLELVQALSTARTTLAFNANSLEDKETGLDPEKDLEKRFEKLFASKYLEFDKNLSEARKKYIMKEMLKGAGIGAAFAVGGILLRELAGELGIINTHHVAGKTNTKPETTTTSRASAVNTPSPRNIADEPAIKTGEQIDDGKATGGGSGSNNEVFSDKISNEGLDGKSDSVWRSTREIFKNNAEKLGYEGDVNDAEALNKWAELQTANAIHNSGEITDKVFEGNNVVLEENGDGSFSVKVETGTGAAPGMLEHSGNTEEVAATKTTQTGSAINKPAGIPLNTETPHTEAPLDTNKSWAQETIKKYGLDPNKFSATDEVGTLKTIVDNHEITIRTDRNLIEWHGPKGNVAQVATDLDKNNILEHIKSFTSDLERSEALLQKNGFSPEDIKSNLSMEDYLQADLGGHQVNLDLSGEKIAVSYEWNGEEQNFAFNSGEGAKGEIERFLVERSNFERSVENIQNDLMAGKTGGIKNFSDLGHRLEEINDGNKLTRDEKTYWQDVYKTNFSGKNSLGLDDPTKLSILRLAMNNFINHRIGN